MVRWWLLLQSGERAFRFAGRAAGNQPRYGPTRWLAVCATIQVGGSEAARTCPALPGAGRPGPVAENGWSACPARSGLPARSARPTKGFSASLVLAVCVCVSLSSLVLCVVACRGSLIVFVHSRAAFWGRLCRCCRRRCCIIDRQLHYNLLLPFFSPTGTKRFCVFFPLSLHIPDAAVLAAELLASVE
jgi:hypothetical protein